MDTESIMHELRKAGNFGEVYQISTFEAVAFDKQGQGTTVEIKILDAGPRVALRYVVAWHSSDGKESSGNPAATIAEAISIAQLEQWRLF